MSDWCKTTIFLLILSCGIIIQEIKCQDEMSKNSKMMIMSDEEILIAHEAAQLSAQLRPDLIPSQLRPDLLPPGFLPPLQALPLEATLPLSQRSLSPLRLNALRQYYARKPSYDPYNTPLGYARGKGHHESSVHRNPYEAHNAYDIIRTQDADLAPHNPYLNPYLAPHLLRHSAQPVAVKHDGKEYYVYDVAKIPDCAYTNKHYYNLTFCLQDDYYPTETILHELDRNRPLVDRLLSDITYQSADNLVDGLTKIEEEGYTYEHYYGDKKYQQFGSDYHGYHYAPDYYKQGGYLCPSDIYYGRPKRAMNTYGKWKVIVNLPDEYYAKGHSKGMQKYSQTQRLEQCMYPSAPCSFIEKKYYSSCLQKHNFVRLLAYTYDEGLHIDSFKMPITCSCHISEFPHLGHALKPKDPLEGA